MSELVVHWQGKPYTVAVGDPDKFTIKELKEELYRKTQVMPKRMKLLGVGTAKTPEDATISSVKLKKKLMMMGTPETVIALNEPSEEERKKLQAEVADDFDLMGEDEANDSLAFYMQPLNQEKLLARCNAYKFNVMNAPRQGKKLLVLDIDYTLFDHHSTCEQPMELARPVNKINSYSIHLYELIMPCYISTCTPSSKRPMCTMTSASGRLQA